MDNETKDKIELEVRRILTSEEVKYRDFLQSHFKTLTWGIGIIIAVSGLVFTFLLGDSIDKLEKRIDSQVDLKMIQYSVDRKVREQLIENIRDAVKEQANSQAVINDIKENVVSLSKDAVSDVADDELREIIKKEINNLNLQDTETLLAKVNIPKGSVLSFNRQKCPNGWSAYKPAFGRFIRGIDPTGTGVDPAGIRAPGSMQEDAVKRHNHRANLEIGAEPISGGAKADQAAGAHGRIGVNYKSEGLLDYYGDAESRPKNVALLYCEKE